MATTTNTKKPTGRTGKMQNSEFHKFFVDELKDIYWAENHLVKALPKMHKAATSEDLKQAIHAHLSETEGHITKLEKVFEMLGKKPKPNNSKLQENYPRN